LNGDSAGGFFDLVMNAVDSGKVDAARFVVRANLKIHKAPPGSFFYSTTKRNKTQVKKSNNSRKNSSRPLRRKVLRAAITYYAVKLGRGPERKLRLPRSALAPALALAPVPALAPALAPVLAPAFAADPGLVHTLFTVITRREKMFAILKGLMI
jgi:hypothetical protein